MRQDPIIKPADQVPAGDVERCRGATIQVLLGPDEGMPNFHMRRFTLAPGGRIPAHRHESIEHQQIMLQGEMVLTIDGREHTVRPGDVIYLPPRSVHAYENRGEVPVQFLCVVPATSEYVTDWQQ